MLITDAYKTQLRAEHGGKSKWGSTAHKRVGRSVVALLAEHSDLTSVLDYGAGKSTLEDYVQARVARSLNWTNYDPGMLGLDSVPTGQYDLVVTSDVLEHVEPECVEDTLELLGRLTRKVMHNNIPCTLTGKTFASGPYKGKDLHLTIKTPDEWRQMFTDLLPDFTELSYKASPKKRLRAVLTHQRNNYD